MVPVLVIKKNCWWDNKIFPGEILAFLLPISAKFCNDFCSTRIVITVKNFVSGQMILFSEKKILNRKMVPVLFCN